MIRIYVAMNESKLAKYESLRSTICPYCFADIYFDVISPVYCHKCREILEPYSDIERDLDKRIEYYRDEHFTTENVGCFG